MAVEGERDSNGLQLGGAGCSVWLGEAGRDSNGLQLGGAGCSPWLSGVGGAAMDCSQTSWLDSGLRPTLLGGEGGPQEGEGTPGPAAVGAGGTDLQVATPAGRG